MRVRLLGRRLGLVLVPLLLAGGLVAGCAGSGDPEGAPSPTAASSTPSASGSASTSPSPTALVEPTLDPAVADADGPEAAVGFLRHYFNTVNYAQATGDVTQLRDLATDGCTPCARGVSTIEEIYRGGGTVSGGVYRVKSATLSRDARTVERSTLYDLRFRLLSSPQAVRRTDSAKPVRTPRGQGDYVMTLAYSDGDWKVVSWYAV